MLVAVDWPNYSQWRRMEESEAKLGKLSLENDDEFLSTSLGSQRSQDVELFLHASELERTGKVGQAIKLYEQAFRLNPDVDRQVSLSGVSPDTLPESLAISKLDNVADQVKTKFQPVVSGALEEIAQAITLLPRYEPLGLPSELLIRILEWVGMLNTASLEYCAHTCARMYIASRSRKIWRKLCHFYQISLPLLVNPREQFFNQPRLRTDGVYICKISYFRPGLTEGAFFQPTHLVTYYRYLRFFGPLEERQVMVMVTPEEPIKVLDTLRNVPSEPLVKFSPSVCTATEALNQLKRRQVNSSLGITRPSRKANLFIGKYRLVPEATHPQFALLFCDPYSSHRQTVFEMLISLTSKRSVICDRYSSYSMSHRPDTLPSHYNFDTKDWGKFVFSRVKSFLS